MSHRPQMFFKKAIEPSKPPSFVILKSMASLVKKGLSDSVPRSDHVPLLIKAKSFCSEGTAVTALCVSCPATAMTFTLSTPSSSAMSALSLPISVPVLTMGANMSLGKPNLSISEYDHSPVLRSTSWEVVAMEYSEKISPVSI